MPEYLTRFAQAMASFGLDEKPFIAAAVSGGGDSMALALLLDEWVKARGGGIIALTVDHGLRDGSRAEAENAGKTLAARGIAHEILTWEGDKPATRIEETARRARYDLLFDACERHGCSALALAHNIEDQAETFWMRLAHGSGVDGLAGMAVRKTEDKSQKSEKKRDILLIRPVLSFTRAELREVCRARGVAWAEDPMNKDEKFLRVRLRKFEEQLVAEGLTPQRLSCTMEKIAQARAALEFYAERAFGECVVLEAVCKTGQRPSSPSPPAPEGRGRERVGVRGVERSEPTLENIAFSTPSPHPPGLWPRPSLSHHATTSRGGEGEEAALLDLSAFRTHPREIQARVLAAALDAVNPQDYPPGSEALDALLDAVLSEDFRGRTLAGCKIAPYRGKIRIVAEDGLRKNIT